MTEDFILKEIEILYEDLNSMKHILKNPNHGDYETWDKEAQAVRHKIKEYLTLLSQLKS